MVSRIRSACKRHRAGTARINKWSYTHKNRIRLEAAAGRAAAISAAEPGLPAFHWLAASPPSAEIASEAGLARRQDEITDCSQ